MCFKENKNRITVPNSQCNQTVTEESQESILRLYFFLLAAISDLLYKRWVQKYNSLKQRIANSFRNKKRERKSK